MTILGVLSTIGVATMSIIITMNELGAETKRGRAVLKVFGIALLFSGLQIAAAALA